MNLKLFEQVLAKFEYHAVKGEIRPVLKEGTLAQLFEFIDEEQKKEYAPRPLSKDEKDFLKEHQVIEVKQ